MPMPGEAFLEEELNSSVGGANREGVYGAVKSGPTLLPPEVAVWSRVGLEVAALALLEM